MKKVFFRTALRVFTRKKSYSILNLFCLTFGLTCTVTGVLYILYMTGYDKFLKDHDRIFEVEALVTYFNGERFAKEPLSASLDEIIKKNVPEFESVARVANVSGSVSSGVNSFSETGIYADRNFFAMFSFPLVTKGSADLLSDPDAIVISERLSKKLFNSVDSIGNTLVLKDGNKQKTFKVTGVIHDVPSQSTLQFDFVIPFARFLSDNSWANDAGASATRIWVTAGKNYDIKKLNRKLKNLIKNQEATLNQELFLFPLREKNLYSYSGGQRVWDKMQSIVILGGISLAILLIACFNFINLSVAQNISRYREVGIKKAFGAGKTSIIYQFLGETTIIVSAAMIIAVMLVRILVNVVNTFMGGDLRFSFLGPEIILSFILIALVTIFLAGFIPSIYLSSPDPVSIFRERKISGHSFSFLRRSMIIFQFIIPVVLMISLLIIKNQDRFMKRYDIGVQRNNVLIIDNTPNLERHRETVVSELLKIPGIDAVSFSNCIPTRGARVTNDVRWEGKDETEKLHFWTVNTDYSFNKVVTVKLTAGRFFDQSYSSDTSCFVINDIAAKVMKMDNPLGRQIVINGVKGTIIGVFKDFHTVDLRGPFTPTIISINRHDRDKLLIKFSKMSYQTLISKAGDFYSKYEPEIAFRPVLFRDLPDLAGLKIISDLAAGAFIIALALACLGLYGLASFTAEWRSAEIGIRKVSGATTLSVLVLLIKNYSGWLLVSFIISLPVAFLTCRLFLSRFYFHTQMPWWAFVAGPAVAFVVAIMAVSLKSYKLASRNPVKSIRYD
jgi:putative ABC transport system permease protein